MQPKTKEILLKFSLRIKPQTELIKICINVVATGNEIPFIFVDIFLFPLFRVVHVGVFVCSLRYAHVCMLGCGGLSVAFSQFLFVRSVCLRLPEAFYLWFCISHRTSHARCSMLPTLPTSQQRVSEE